MMTLWAILTSQAENFPELVYFLCLSFTITLTNVSWKMSLATSWSLTTNMI